jgi:predicted short-subunit dehydrogenase-like oxidoreductase (DUF2520 family)
MAAFYHAGFIIDKIYGRTIESLSFASRYGVSFDIISPKMEIESDLVILCVPDDAISDVSKMIFAKNKKQIIAHTSGTASITNIDEKHNFKGVFYPLQTFKKGQFTNMRQVPFCIHGNESSVVENLQHVANKLSDYVHIIEDTDRKKLHLSAVFINNFINYLIGQIQKYTAENAIPFDLLEPLLKETIRKAIDGNALQNQTGPAKRNDIKTISQHIDLLEEKPELLKLYAIFTENIKNHYETNR